MAKETSPRQIRNDNKGIVIMQSKVLSKIQLADNSASLPWISARLRITEAQGVAAKINKLALKGAGNGMKKNIA